MKLSIKLPGQRWLPRWLPRRLTISLAILALALAVLGWSIWQTHWAWQSGYGDEDMSAFALADPRSLSGGDLTSFHKGFKPFGQAAANLPWQYAKIFEDGDGLFEHAFVPAVSPRIDGERAGLGPLYNANACGACHFRDGPVESPYQTGGQMNGIFLRLSVADGKGGWQAPTGYHSQLRDKSIAGVPAEGMGVIEWEELPGTFPDGEPYRLRRPHFRVDHPGYGPLPENLIIEARSAPRLVGMGLLEAVDDSTLLAMASSIADHADGVSGRVNRVIDAETGKTVIGRFSLKANEPNLRAQTAGAAFNDMGLTSPLHPRELCLPGQQACQLAVAAMPTDRPDLAEEQLQALTVYLQLLAVPARRDVNEPQVMRGERLFAQAGCTACHRETLQTGDSHPIKRLRRQTIHPYTDLLLHDMGPGLSGRPDGEAGAQEWRTAPLWGIGLTERSNHHTHFLHDQRARSLQEAVLWHDGEAAVAQQRFVKLPRADRQALIRFLESL
ncbi:di-heme oxidoredictase family protein [Rhodocyclus tenuis]|uniref:di-heme oxidoreductase family protein n=1 Tax=Rhodocyclus tenuis TaxID=1066 RepID=UPI001904F14F|nr:di-heme oxidoredictase family protein [Rhodocyclus tenuis]MBK1680883.1 hypothetical protein [Rhodocyclus tenuis]